MMLLFGSIWKSTLYYAYKRHERKVSIIFNVIEQRIFFFQFSFYCLPTVMAGVGAEGLWRVREAYNAILWQAFADPIIDSPGSHSAVNQRHSCSFANLRKRIPFMNGRRSHQQLLPWLSSSSTFSFFSILRIHFHFVDSQFYARLGVVAHNISKI